VKTEEYNKEFYGCKLGKPLTEYQRRVNDASTELCLHNLDLLSNRQLLSEAARERVDKDGYQYKKRKIAIKVAEPTDQSGSPKRRKISKEYNINRIGELEEKIKDLTEQNGFKEKWQECQQHEKLQRL